MNGAKEQISILVAEDNPTNIFYLEAVIRKSFPSIHVIKAHDGEEALAMYSKFLPEIILLDLHMPIMNGDVAASKIRHRAKDLPHKPIIIGLTASIPSANNQTFENYIDIWLTKPISKDELTAALNRQLEVLANYQSKTTAGQVLVHCDFRELSISLGNDQSLMAEVLQYAADYLEHFPVRMATLIEREDWPALIKLAHELRGAALNARLPLMAHLAYRVEHQKQFHTDLVWQQLEAIKTETNAVLPLIACSSNLYKVQ